MSKNNLIDAYIVIVGVTVFSAVGVLVFLALKKTKVALVVKFVKTSSAFRFLYTVTSGVTTYFITDALFGRGIENSSITGIATAIVIGLITKVTGGNDVSNLG